MRQKNKIDRLAALHRRRRRHRLRVGDFPVSGVGFSGSVLRHGVHRRRRRGRRDRLSVALFDPGGVALADQLLLHVVEAEQKYSLFFVLSDTLTDFPSNAILRMSIESIFPKKRILLNLISPLKTLNWSHFQRLG